MGGPGSGRRKGQGGENKKTVEELRLHGTYKRYRHGRHSSLDTAAVIWAGPAGPAVDVVGSYVADVLDDPPRVLAGRAVHLACEHHRTDLSREKTPDFPYAFDVEAAWWVVSFFEECLTLENGDPFKLDGWQAFCTGSIFGWKHAGGKRDGLRRFQVAYVETGKGSGKTPWVAGLGLYGLMFDNEQSAEIYACAFDRAQAGIMLRDAIRMAEDSEKLSPHLLTYQHNISHAASNSFFRAVSSEHRGASGQRPHYVLIDELHEHRDARVVTKMKAGFKKHPQPLQVEITNAGHDRSSICWEHHEKSMKTLEGTAADETWFAYICQLDACEACRADGWRQPKDGCPDCDAWTDPAVWPKTNPGIGTTVTLDYLRRQVDQALAIPSEQALVKRLNFCLWTEGRETWIPADAWHACTVASISSSNERRNPCAAGLDLSSKLDLSACVVAVKIPDDPVAAGAQTAVEKAFRLNFTVDLVPFFWLPADTLIKRAREDRIPYDVWARQGRLFTTPGAVIDYDVIYDKIVNELAKRFAIQRLGYDPYNATQMAVQLRDKGRVEVVEVLQGKKLSEACKLFEALVVSRRLRHDGHPVLAWNVANADVKSDRYENLWVQKASNIQRIDGLTAAITALSQLMVLPFPSVPRGGTMLNLDEEEELDDDA